jgi:two-component system, OmpR family, copper resistance phosphate regulon response regulator CusR
MNILIVENDLETRDRLTDELSAEGFSVDVSGDGEEGLGLARSKHRNMIILDVALPSRDGFSVLEELRNGGNRTPVFFTSARDVPADRIRGLDMGADDFLTKPFAVRELIARIRSVMRRMALRSPGSCVIVDLELDLVRHRAFRSGQRLALTPKEFNLLSLLARNAGETLTRETIAEQIWDAALEDGSNVVDVHVRRLRAKLDDPFQVKLVHTVRGVGYVLRDPAAA